MKKFTSFLYFIAAILLTNAYHLILDGLDTFTNLSDERISLLTIVFGILFGIVVALLYFGGIRPNIEE